MPEVAGKTVILVDDGLATGASMRAAIQALRQLRPSRIVVAVPAAPESTCRDLAAAVDEVVCATTPSPFFAVGQSYWDFTQTTDQEVRDLLRAASTAPPAAADARGLNEVAVIRSEATPVSDCVPDEDALLDLVGDAHFVLIGEASHGTHEFYAARQHDAAADREERILRRGRRGGLAGRLPREPVCPRPWRGRDGRGGTARLRALSRLDVAQYGGARLRGVAARAQ